MDALGEKAFAQQIKRKDFKQGRSMTKEEVLKE